MATVEQSLCLPELQEVSVRAGKGGLVRRIRWVHVIDTDDVGHFLEGGELLLTCGQVWPKDRVREEKLLQSFVRDQISGIIFATGHYLDDCPAAALEYGEQYQIPILEMPFEIPFVKVTQAINQTILSDQYRMTQLMTQVSSTLIEKLKAADDYEEICKILGYHFKSPVVMTTLDKKRLAAAIPDGHRHVNLPKLIKDLTDRLENQTSEDEVVQRKIRIIDVPHSIFPYTLAIPLRTEDDDWGILWLFGSHPLEEQAHILEFAAAILSDLYLQQREVGARRKRLQSELLELLLEKPEIAPKIVESKMEELGLKVENKWIIGHVLIDKGKHLKTEDLCEGCQKWLDETKGMEGFCQVYERQLILLISSNLDHIQLKGELTKLHGYLCQMDQTICPTLVFGGIQSDWSALDEGLQEAESLMPMVRNRAPRGGVYFADELRREMILYRGFDRERADELRRAILPREFFFERGEMLYETLKCLALNDFNREKVAAILHIHRNTLRYRIERIEELLQNRLSSSRCRFWIQVALDLESLSSSL